MSAYPHDMEIVNTNQQMGDPYYGRTTVPAGNAHGGATEVAMEDIHRPAVELVCSCINCLDITHDPSRCGEAWTQYTDRYHGNTTNRIYLPAYKHRPGDRATLLKAWVRETIEAADLVSKEYNKIEKKENRPNRKALIPARLTDMFVDAVDLLDNGPSGRMPQTSIGATFNFDDTLSIAERHARICEATEYISSSIAISSFLAVKVGACYDLMTIGGKLFENRTFVQDKQLNKYVEGDMAWMQALAKVLYSMRHLERVQLYDAHGKSAIQALTELSYMVRGEVTLQGLSILGWILTGQGHKIEVQDDGEDEDDE